MIVLINGTSNSILKDGYASKLDENFSLKNISIGASCSIAGLYNIILFKERAKKSFNIIDFCINDDVYINNGWISCSHLEDVVVSMYQMYSNLSENAVSIAFPAEEFHKLSTKNYAYRLHRRCCEEYGFAFLDGYEFFSWFNGYSHYLWRAFYRDPMHLNPEPSSMMADEIENYLYSRSNNNHLDKIPSLNNLYSAKSIDDFPLDKGLRYARIGTSLRSEMGCFLTCNDVLTIFQKGALSGIFIDASETNSYIIIENGKGERVIKNLNGGSLPKRKCQFKFIPIYDLFDLNGKLKISVSSDAIPTEKSPHERPVLTKKPKLVICGFLFKKVDFSGGYTKKTCLSDESGSLIISGKSIDVGWLRVLFWMIQCYYRKISNRLILFRSLRRSAK